jgi:septal ring factor EnvC (AmiA/AmiB activator)
MLERAALSLAEADRASDRITALTETVRAYEDGLGALRDGLRRASIQERTINLVFEAERERLARLLGVLQTMERSAAPLLLIHPSGPIGTARSGMIVSEVTPAVANDAMALRAELEELALLQAVQQAAIAQLADGLRGIQEARTQLSGAMADRRDLPPRLAFDTEALSLILESAESLDGFAANLREQAFSTAAPVDLPDFAEARGQLPMPLRGTVLRGYNSPDAAGVIRPGLVLAADPLSLVTAPWPATIRYVGPLLDYGVVAILEPGPDHLLILAGMGEAFGQVGDVLDLGAPVGLMGGSAQIEGDLLITSSQGGGVEQTETLYIELRQAGEPVDPSAWFETEIHEE